MRNFLTFVRARPPPRSDATWSCTLAAIRCDGGSDPGGCDRGRLRPGSKV